MNNADHPAFVGVECEGVGLGLTKREEFAKAAMQGLLSNPVITETPDHGSFIAMVAVWHADFLLAALAKEKKA